jgi:hypothetical protein
LLQELDNLTTLIEKIPFLKEKMDTRELDIKSITNWLKDINDLNSNINSIKIEDIFNEANYNTVKQNY